MCDCPVGQRVRVHGHPSELAPRSFQIPMAPLHLGESFFQPREFHRSPPKPDVGFMPSYWSTWSRSFASEYLALLVWRNSAFPHDLNPRADSLLVIFPSPRTCCVLTISSGLFLRFSILCLPFLPFCRARLIWGLPGSGLEILATLSARLESSLDPVYLS